MKRHLLLIGLPGSGKTSVGRQIARTVGYPFVDIDAVVEVRAGKTIARIFDEEGEPRFRTLDLEETDRALNNEPAIIATGGGWAAQPGALERARAHAVIVYLETPPPTAAARAAASDTRPLLQGRHPEGRMEELLTLRAPFYEQADLTVSTQDRTAAAVAAAVVELARSRVGW